MFDNIRDDYRTHGRSLLNRGFWAMVTYRYGAWTLRTRPAPVRWFFSKTYGVLRLANEILTGTTISPATRIGAGFHIVHAEAPILIHPDTVIGERCGVMHSVTIGTNMGEGTPVIGDDVFIGAGAVVLGDVRIGDRAHISANSLVISDVPADSIAIGVPARAMPRMPDIRQRQDRDQQAVS